MLDLIRPELRALENYTPPERDVETIWLNANESPWDENAVVIAENINRYPADFLSMVKDQLAALYQVEPAQLLLTRGSDEAIDIIVRLFCIPYQDAVLTCPPTFSMYAQSAILQGAKIIEIPLLDNTYALDMENMLLNAKKTKVIFLCSPNNPTGNLIDIKDILTLIEHVQEKTIVVVDEAYIEFSDGISAKEYITTYPNLMVLRTLSKAYGLAGLRCGVIMANPIMITMLRKVMPPFPFPTIVIRALLASLNNEKMMERKKNIVEIIEQRNTLKNKLRALPCVIAVYESDANFLLVAFKEVEKVYQRFLEAGILVRAFKENYTLRISIGTAKQNEKLCTILEKMSKP